ncbi:TRAP transporter small permease [Alsobacter sp. KACC 23698]|uniref:TRAP transporter small permease protein n=1 Tax=Alsobacter sp. KACC 23698 TaxID=3149229 RepID=A0AAU7JLM7_9HYPH
MSQEHSVGPASRRARVIAAVAQAQTWLAMAAAGVIVVSTTADVVLRYGLGKPIHGAYDVVECMLALFVFHGLSAVFLTRSNITIDLVDHFVGPVARRALVRFGDLVQVLALALIAWAMISPAIQAYDYGDRKLELGLPLWVVWVFVFTGIAGTILSAIGALLSPVPGAGGAH